MMCYTYKLKTCSFKPSRFPCKTTDKTEFERRSTTPKNWKRLAKDKTAIKMLSEIVGIGAEGM